jgi:hypothetical protein
LANAGYVTPDQLGSALAASGFATPEILKVQFLVRDLLRQQILMQL